MILSLRKRHRANIAALTALLPIVFVCGIMARRTVPVIDLPSDLHPAFPGEVIQTEAGLWPGKRIRTVLRTTPTGSLTAQFIFEDSVGPDVLAYWIPGEILSGASLPDNAQLLGPLSIQTVFHLTRKLGATGRFLLYSLANQEIIATSNLLNLPPT
jgi:hypothetical protein